MDLKNNKIVKIIIDIKNDYDKLFYDSYIAIRRSIGILGISLPILLILGGIALNHCEVEESLSAYYHNNLGDIFVLMLGAAGILLIIYRGGEKIVRTLTTLGGIMGLFVIIFPNKEKIKTIESVTQIDVTEKLYGVFQLPAEISDTFHLIAAVSFFVLLGIVSFSRFTKHTPGTSPKRLAYDRLYRIFGLTAGICGVVYGVIGFFPQQFEFAPVLFVELLGLEAMGLSWFFKGNKNRKN